MLLLIGAIDRHVARPGGYQEKTLVVDVFWDGPHVGAEAPQEALLLHPHRVLCQRDLTLPVRPMPVQTSK